MMAIFGLRIASNIKATDLQVISIKHFFLRKRRKTEAPPTWCYMLGGVKDTTRGVKGVTRAWTPILG